MPSTPFQNEQAQIQGGKTWCCGLNRAQPPANVSVEVLPSVHQNVTSSGDRVVAEVIMCNEEIRE